MEMWLKRAILLFLTVSGAAMVMLKEIHINLTDAAKSENVLYGSTLVLHCCLNTSGYEKCRINWLFQPSGSDGNPLNITNVHTSSENLKSSSNDLCFSVTATEFNAGWYSCNVTKEIPVLTQTASNRTEIIVEKGNTPVPSLTTQSPVIPNDDHKNMSLWIVIGASSLVLLLLILLVICAVHRRCCRRREQPIYINTRAAVKKQPSPRPGLQVASLKNKPSSEDLRTPSPSRRYEQGTRRCKH
nr:uncharacterized protein LOC107393355 isoform X1 [Nothobranchius furzeri]